MAERDKAYCRLDPINHAYLRELAKLGPYGKDKSDVMRRFIEEGIKEAIEKGVIAKKSAEDFGSGVSKDSNAESS